MPKVDVRVGEDLYRRLLDKAKEEGVPVSELVRRALLAYLGREPAQKEAAIDEARVKRMVLDLVNPFTAKIDDIAKKLASAIERLEALEDRVENVERMVKELKTGGEAEAPKEAKKARRTAMDILREQKVMFESDVARKIRDRDSFFSRLEKKGAVVVEAKDGRIAVEPGFWQAFLEKLKNVKTSNDEEIKKLLDKDEYRLFKALRESALIVFDATTKTWSMTR